MKENVNAVPDEEMNSEQDVQQKHDCRQAEGFHERDQSGCGYR